MNNIDSGKDEDLTIVWTTMKFCFENPNLKLDMWRKARCYEEVYDYCATTDDNVQVLHNKLKDFFWSHLNRILNLWDTLNGAENIVSFYAKQWENYKISSRQLDWAFLYFNRRVRNYTFVVVDLSETNNLARLMWKQLIFESRREQLTNAILTLIDCQRKGVKMLCYSSIRSALELYLDEQPSLETYQQHFEQQFLKATRLFYSNDSSICLEEEAVFHYIKEATFLESTIESRFTNVASIKLEKYLEAERELITQCFHTSTLAPVMKLFEDILIQTNCDKLCIVFLLLLSEEKPEYFQCLGTLYKIIARFDDTLGKIMEYFIKYVENQCTNVLEEFGKCIEKSPITTITNFLDIHRKYSKVVVEAFGNDCRFLENLDTVCLKTTRDKIIKCPQSSQGFGELLALYCDSLLRKSKRNMGDAEVEEAFGNLTRLFKYMGDEDVASFKKFYKSIFFDRLILGKLAGDLAEKGLFNKLDAIGEYGFSYELRELQEMSFRSKNVSQEFSIELEKADFTLAMDVQIYASIPDARKSEEFKTVSLPTDLEEAVSKFNEVYIKRHSGKHLTWQHHLIVSNCYKKRYEFRASTFQMVILLMYNSEDSYCMQALADGTGLPMRKLVQVVESLIKAKLLVSSDPTRKVAAETVVSYREDYANQKRRVNINISHHTNY